MKRHLIFAAALFWVISSVHPLLYGQSESAIYGTVTAKADGSALPNTKMRLESPATSTVLTTTTTADGRFTFQGLVPGQYTLVASHDDFQDQTFQLTLKPREVQNITMQIPLRGITESVEVKAPAEIVASTYSPSSTTLDKQ